MIKQVFTIFLIYTSFTVFNTQAQNYTWAKNIGSNLPGGQEIFSKNIAVDIIGNLFISGYFEGTVDFNPGAGTDTLISAGSFDIFFAKYDQNGNYLWAKSIGSTMSEICFSMVLDGNGNLYLGGYYGDLTDFDPGNGIQNLNFLGSEDIFLAKYDNNGNYIWAKGFGGTGLDAIYSMSLDGNGNILVTGVFESIADFDPGAAVHSLTAVGVPGNSNLFFAKYDTSGTYVWANQIPTNSGQTCISSDANGNTHLAGSFFSTVDFNPGSSTTNLTATGAGDIFFAMYDANGIYVYAYNIGGASIQAGLDKATDIAVDNSGNVYLCGNFGQGADFNPGIGTDILTSNWSEDIFFAKYDANGNYVWAKNFASDYPFPRIVLDNNADVLLTGGFLGTTDLDPGPNVANLVSNGNADIFFAKYDNNGEYLSAKSIGNNFGNDIGTAIATDGNGNIFVTGVFSDSADFDPGLSSAMLYTSAPFSQDVFYAKYSSGPVTVENYKQENIFCKVYPNPFSEIFIVETNSVDPVPYQITDVTGRIISSGTITQHQNLIDISKAAGGVYILATTNGAARLIKK